MQTRLWMTSRQASKYLASWVREFGGTATCWRISRSWSNYCKGLSPLEHLSGRCSSRPCRSSQRCAASHQSDCGRSHTDLRSGFPTASVDVFMLHPNQSCVCPNFDAPRNTIIISRWKSTLEGLVCSCDDMWPVQKERVDKANEEAARRFAEMDLSATGTTAGHAPPPPAMQSTHPYPVPQHGPAAPQAAPYASYPAVPGTGDWSQPYPQYQAHSPYAAPRSSDPPPQQPPQHTQQHHPQHAHHGNTGPHHQAYGGAPPPYGPQDPERQQSYNSQAYGQNSNYYQAQTYPQGPYGQYPPPGYH